MFVMVIFSTRVKLYAGCQIWKKKKPDKEFNIQVHQTVAIYIWHELDTVKLLDFRKYYVQETFFRDRLEPVSIWIFCLLVKSTVTDKIRTHCQDLYG